GRDHDDLHGRGGPYPIGGPYPCGRGRCGRDAYGRWRRRHRPALRRGHTVRDREELRQIAQRFAPIGELEPGPSGVPLSEGGVDEARVFLAGTDEVALVRECRRETAVRRKIEGRDLDRDPEERDRVHAIVLAGEGRGAFAQRDERGVAILERDTRPREPTVRVHVAVLAHELAVRGLGLTQPAAREELRGSVAREAVVVRHLRLDRTTLLRERPRELGRLLVVHDLGGAEARALGEREDVGSFDSVRVHAHRVALAGQERGCGRTEVFLRDAEELKGERGHGYSSPPLPTSSPSAAKRSALS